MLAENALLNEIDWRLRQFFAGQRDGRNSSPASRYQIEGLLEAAVLTGSASEPELWLRLSTVYTEIFGAAPEQQFGSPWENGEFPAIPVCGVRAPVYPTTRDD